MGITQQLKKGEPFNTETKQTGIYVAAKRLGLTVKTERIDDNTIRVTFIDKPKEPTLINRIADLSPPERLALFEHFELCCGMNRGSCICEPETVETSQPIQPIADERKSVLNALQAKIDAIQDHNIEPEHQDDDSWIEMDTTIENGETLYWHRKPKGRPICYRKEVNWDSFA